MPTRYFAASVDQNWDTLGNWWSDAACTEGFSGTLTGVTVTDTDETVTCDSTAGLVVGRPITGDGIDTGTTVASITDGTTFELSQAAISTETSDLTCELHVIPVTGDDVVIATGNGTVAGTPSADVLGLVTVNGNSALDVTLAATSFVFNDTSQNNDALTGSFIFNDTSRNWTGSLTGDPVFNDSSENAYGASPPTVIYGNPTFNDTSINGDTIIGNATLNDSTINYGSIDGDTTLNDNSQDSVYSYGIFGNVTVTNTAFSTALTGFFNPLQSTVSGTVDFPNGATFTLTGSESWSVDASAWTGTLAWVFTGNSANGSTLGNATVRQHAADFVAWRDYATSTYVTGTLTLQFPEMDILGTGLL